jgi:tellurite resistance protein TehA-like permease
MVFPLGMYTTATAVYARASGQDFLLPIAQVFVWIALASWLTAFAGLVLRLARAARHRADRRRENGGASRRGCLYQVP